MMQDLLHKALKIPAAQSSAATASSEEEVCTLHVNQQRQQKIFYDLICKMQDLRCQRPVPCENGSLFAIRVAAPSQHWQQYGAGNYRKTRREVHCLSMIQLTKCYLMLLLTKRANSEPSSWLAAGLQTLSVLLMRSSYFSMRPSR